MGDFTLGDFCFIAFILCVIHGIMIGVGWLRRRQGPG